jgi:hypothetical protein
MSQPDATVRTVRMRVRNALARTEAEFKKHVKQFNCRTDFGGCTERAEFQARILTLNQVLQMLKRRKEPND